MKKILLAFMLFAGYAHAQMPILVKDINPGPGASSTPVDFFTYNGNVVFAASSFTGRALWISDGTDAGTTEIKNINIGGYGTLKAPIILNGNILYAGQSTDGVELWKTNGATAGTSLVSDINTGSGNSSPAGFTLFSGKVYFTATDATHGTEPWVTDGTAAGTKMLMDIMPNNVGSDPREYTVLNSKLFFRATSGAGEELWVTDGTTAGTAIFKPGTVSPTALKFFNNKIYFNAYNTAAGVELWVTDGTVAGTIMLTELWPGAATNSTPYGFTECNGKLFFLAEDAKGIELWITDGTVAGTKMVKDIKAGALSGVSGKLCAYNNKVYFAGDDGTGKELWVSDGTDAGTVALKKIYPTTGSNPERFTVYNGRLYYVATNATRGAQLWVTDGTADSTKIVPIPTTAAQHAMGYQSNMGVANGKLFFAAAYDATVGTEVYSLTTASLAGVQNIAVLTDLKLYPNPAKESVTIQYTLTQQGSPQYRLYDMAGRCVAIWYDAGTLTGHQSKQLDISNLAPAVYQLQIEVNGKVQMVSVVKQ